MGLPWNAWQVWNKHTRSDFACPVQPGAAGAQAVFTFTDHVQAAQSTLHHKSEHPQPLVSTWKCFSLSQGIIRQSETESELLFSVLSCPNSALIKQGKRALLLPP